MNVYLHTLGCRANQADSESVRAMLLDGGAAVVAEAADADVAIVNSCAVTAAAEADLRQIVRRIARARPSIRTLVVGCAAARAAGGDGDDGLRALPGVHAVVPGSTREAVADAVGAATGLALAPGPSRRPQTGARALLRIQDGCEEHCTFCATVLARGRARSRPASAVVEDARRLADHHAEVVLTGVHIGSYGVDTGASLGALVQRLMRELPQVRFRLSSLEATEVDDRLRELFTAPRQLAPFLHAPLQSGSDRVLRRMGRHWYTASSYARAVERLAAACPVLGLGADVIAGFPGESPADHAATLALVQALPFTALHVFPYSARPGAAATRLPEQLSGDVVAARAAALRAVGRAAAARHQAARAGGRCDVIVVGAGARRTGVTEDHLPVELPGFPPPADPLARGARFDGTLSVRGARLIATPDAAIFHA